MRTYNKHEIALLFEDTDRFVADSEYEKILKDNKVMAALNDSFPLEIVRLEDKIAELESRLKEGAKCAKKN